MLYLVDEQWGVMTVDGPSLVLKRCRPGLGIIQADQRAAGRAMQLSE